MAQLNSKGRNIKKKKFSASRGWEPRRTQVYLGAFQEM